MDFSSGSDKRDELWHWKCPTLPLNFAY